MAFTPRPYQQDAVDAAITFFSEKKKYNAIMILPTGSGKSVVLANIAKSLTGKTIILQPSKEILAQNYAKFISTGERAGIYSASAGKKFIDKVTFATIGSIIQKKYLFSEVKNILIDECHLVNANAGMYFEFIGSLPEARTIGVTATPYRLGAGYPDGAMLKFITRTRPKIFNKVIYHIQNKTLFDAGHLAKLEYFTKDIIDRSRLKTNTTGTDFTEQSLKDAYQDANMQGQTVDVANRVLSKRKNLLIFCTMISEAMQVTKGIPGAVIVTGDTEAAERDRILSDFKSGRIRCVVNVGVLTTGFDYPELEATLIARSTMSLSLYYQMIGRVMRPHPNKSTSWVIDLGGNYNFFGKIETMEIRQCERGHYSIWQGTKQLTNVSFTKT
jgi:DNA repair protein RadD